MNERITITKTRRKVFSTRRLQKKIKKNKKEKKKTNEKT